MTENSDPWVPLSSDALRARRAQQRRRSRRRSLLALAACAIVIVGALAFLLSSSGRIAQAPVAGHTNVVARHSPEPSGSTTSRSRPRESAEHVLIAREDAAIDRLLVRQPFINAGGGERREIALTFDDGPGPYTPLLLNLLQRLRAPATFFEIGFMFRWFHASMTRELRMGGVIGDHTETHPMMALLSPVAQQSEILTQTEWVRRYGGPFPRLWRPPYGSYDAATLALLHRFHMLMVLWTIDTNDYRRSGVAAIVNAAVAGSRPGAIILMHDAGGNRTQTIAALPLIVHALRKRGYRLVTIPQLILEDPPRHREILPTNLAGG